MRSLLLCRRKYVTTSLKSLSILAEYGHGLKSWQAKDSQGDRLYFLARDKGEGPLKLEAEGRSGAHFKNMEIEFGHMSEGN